MRGSRRTRLAWLALLAQRAHAAPSSSSVSVACSLESLSEDDRESMQQHRRGLFIDPDCGKSARKPNPSNPSSLRSLPSLLLLWFAVEETMKKMALTAFVALAFGMLSANALEVVSPSGGISVIANRAYTVEWTGTTTGRFEIDLYFCNSFCMEDVCGDWVTALCPYGADGCPDSAGDYDIIMPEPMSGTSSGYKVMVKNAEDESDMGCSDDFTLIASEDAPEPGDMGYSLTVTSPSDGDTAMAGEVYTVEWDYENGFGSSTDRFALDLYLVGGTGDCGTYLTTLCDKPTIGCPDSQGDYDVEIPSDTPDGMYSIRVGVFDDETMYDCSDTFEIETSDDINMSMRL